MLGDGLQPGIAFARCPCAVRARARFIATVVFPTPPFPLATATIGTCSELSGIYPPRVPVKLKIFIEES